MTTNDLITLIINNFRNADDLAQITTAIECVQEALAETSGTKALASDPDKIFTHRVKVFRTSGEVEYVKCVSLEDAQVARRQRIQRGDVKLALIGTSEEMAELTRTFGN